MIPIKNNLFLKAARSEPVPRPPVWMMRQAGRFMKEYWAIKEKYSFMEMVKSPEIAADVTMLPVDLLGIDAAIMFCDILVTGEALGSELSFHPGIGPQFSHPIRNAEDVNRLTLPVVSEKLSYVRDMIHIVKERLAGRIPLIGFAGAPFTVLSYLVEGGSTKEFKRTKLFLFNQPVLAHQLLQKITQITIEYLQLQIEAGVDALQIFDSWAMALSWDDYKEFSHHYIQQIIGSITGKVPIISFCKGSSVFAPLMAEAKPEVISVDWNADLASLRKSIPPNIALQGNLDPSVLYAEKEVIKKRIYKLFDQMKDQGGYIFNLGHGIMPDIPFDNVKYAVDLIKEYSW
jgi:uroporphyrinogen decarboxylase